jgi:hypothetical protein
VLDRGLLGDDVPGEVPSIGRLGQKLIRKFMPGTRAYEIEGEGFDEFGSRFRGIHGGGSVGVFLVVSETRMETENKK